MASDPAKTSDLLAQCENEPIHIPGAIQPFGILLTVDARDLSIENISDNSAELWRKHPHELLGKSLSAFLSQEDLERVKAYLASSGLEEQALRVTLLLDDTGTGHEWDLKAHNHLHTLYLEFEPAAPAGASSAGAAFHHAIRDAVRALQQADSLQDLCDKAAQQVRKATGFDRVMIYRFDEDWHGAVISEARSEQATSYLGHHFPASDIPAQARAVFLQNWLRMIPDVDYVPSRIHPGVHPASGAPLDLGKALLRSVSPIHLEYLRNMGVGASLTVSLVDDGRLWGLIACHHATPLMTSPDARIAAELIGQIVSSQLRIKEEHEDRQYRAQLDQARRDLMNQLESEPELAVGLKKHAAGIQDMLAAQVGSVAICYGNEWTCVGHTPPLAAMEKIVTWLADTLPDQGVFASNSLLTCHPEAAAYKDVASGLLAMSITRAERDYVLWFRPEAITTVTWAGGPDKVVRESGTNLSLHPRKSFESWREVVTGTATPWRNVETDAVADLRNDIIALALQQEYRKEQEARRRAEQMSREKDEMVMMVSHDLKTPLNVIGMSYEFIQRFHPGKEPSVQRMVERGERAVTMMNKLITNILDVAKIEAGTLDLDLKVENAADMTREIVDISSPLASERSIELVAALPCETYNVVCERFRILQVLNNLVSNALKFTPHGGKVIVSVHPQESEVLFKVSDTGEGVAPEHLETIFERFWQIEKTKHRGTGLGLWISKGIVEKHNGKIWATSQIGRGSTFHFTLARDRCTSLLGCHAPLLDMRSQ